MRLDVAHPPRPVMKPGSSGRACVLLLIAALCVELVLLALGATDEVTRSGNESSRWATVESVVERGTVAIGRSTFETVDRVKIGDRFYSNKPLLLSLWIAALHAPAHFLFGLSFSPSYHLPVFLLTVAGVCSFSVLLTWLFQDRLRSRGHPCGVSILLGLAVVFTTWIWSYGTTLNNHTPAAALLFALIVLLERELASPSRRRALAAGLVAGVLMAVEIPTGGTFFAVGLAVLLVKRRPRRGGSVGPYLLGFLGVTLSMAAVNYAVYGYPLDAYLVPGAFAFAESIHADGVAGLRKPENVGSYLFHITFGYRGLWSHMPVLLLAPIYLWRRRRDLGSLDLLTAAGAGALLLFYGSRTGIFGGWAYGFRFLVPLIPVLFWWSSLWLLEKPRLLKSALAAGLLAVGLLTSSMGAQNPWPVAHEGAATKPSAVESRIRSPFLSNLLVWSFERDPDGVLFRRLSEEVYGRELTAAYLQMELWNRRDRERIDELRRLVERWRRESSAGDL